MQSGSSRLGSLVIGVYGWVVTVFFGGVLLDIAYSQLLLGNPEFSERKLAFSVISDLLLMISGVVIVTAIGAIAFAWEARISRNLFAASLMIFLFGLLIPVIFSPFIQGAQNVSFGPYLRLLLNGSASIITFVGLYTFYKRK